MGRGEGEESCNSDGAHTTSHSLEWANNFILTGGGALTPNSGLYHVTINHALVLSRDPVGMRALNEHVL